MRVEYWKRRNKETYNKTDKILSTMRRLRAAFYWKFKDNWWEKIFQLLWQNPETQVNWFKEVKAAVRKIGINEAEIKNRNVSRDRVKTFKGFQEKVKKKAGAIWTDERRHQNRGKLRQFWKEKKE